MLTTGFVPPPYPYSRLDGLLAIAAEHDGGAVDLSIGTPMDPAPPEVVAAFSRSGTERGYPSSPGSPDLRQAASRWIARRFDVEIDPSSIAACIGTKEFVGTLPQWLRLRRPDRDTILYPAISYPTYEMGAILAGCRAVPVPFDPAGRLALAEIAAEDARRALALWINSPGNPTGVLDDLGAAAAWGRANDVPVFSDECYVEFTWSSAARSILQHGSDGVIALHSLSKRSNLAGARIGFYAGDADLVQYLLEVRKHVGMMMPGPSQAVGVLALDDDDHVALQRQRYAARLAQMATVLGTWTGQQINLPDGGFYLWFPVGDAWAWAERLAREGGAVVSPGEFYGSVSTDHVRVAVVQPDDRIELVAQRLGV